jgi:hypothetical protein
MVWQSSYPMGPSLGRDLLEVPALPFALIHLTAWKWNSRKFTVASSRATTGLWWPGWAFGGPTVANWRHARLISGVDLLQAVASRNVWTSREF